MYRHKYFELRLHDAQELAAITGSQIVSRNTLHEWPLSCVQRLILADGSRLIYKTQSGPTVEPEVYARADPELMVPARTIYQADGHVCMLLEPVDAPQFSTLNLSETELIRHGRAVIARLQEIDRGLPYLDDVSTFQLWSVWAETQLENLRYLISKEIFELVNEATLTHLEAQAFSAPVRDAFRSRIGYVHGDLGGDNLFLLPDGYRLIDWQRPFLGPFDLDLATLLEGAGYDPMHHFEPAVVWLMALRRIFWFGQCARRWFPAGAAEYDRSIARLAAKIGPE